MINDNRESSDHSPLVSVVIPAYNAGYLREAVESVVSQTFRNFELIVVDDGSPGDSIKQICSDFPDVHYIRQANAGPSVGRNRGIREARGELIAFLDDDDVWLPEKLEKQVAFYDSISNKSDVGLIYGGQYLFDGETVFGAKVDSANGMVYPYLLFGQFIGTCSSVVIPRTVFDEVGFFDKNLICTQDYEFFLRIARRKLVYSIDEPLIKYRTRPDQITKDPALNNREDAEVLAMQKPYVSHELFRRVLAFNRQLCGERYKTKAYEALFHKRQKLDYMHWLFRSVVASRRLPTLPSTIYLLSCLVPGKLAEHISALKRRDQNSRMSASVWRQEVASDDFTWMGFSRGHVNLTSLGAGQIGTNGERE